MADGNSGIIKFERKDQYNDLVTILSQDKELSRKCMGLESGLMILCYDISESQKGELMDASSGGTWYDDFKLSLTG